MNPLIDEAQMLYDEGFNPLPLFNTKAPMLKKGHPYLYEKIDKIEWRFKKAEKIGIACGAISEGFYCIDFDAHKGQNIKQVFDYFVNLPNIQYLINTGQLSVYSTAGGGYHVYFKHTEEIIKGTVFAHWEDGETMVELRGNGQYVACYPSTGYQYITGVEIVKIQPLEEYQWIFDLLTTFNQYHKKTKIKLANNHEVRKWAEYWRDNTPTGKYNIEFANEAKELLVSIGWQLSDTRPDGVEYYTRPNKDVKDGFSATFGHQLNMFYIFTSDASIAPFEPNKGYAPFDILSIIKYKGDWKTAKEELAVRFGMENNDKFWSINQEGKHYLNNYRFKKFLEENNFFKISPNERSTFDFVKKDDIFLKIVYEKDIKDYVTSWILDNNIQESVYNLMTGNLKYFRRDFLSMLESKNVNILKDTKDTAYLFYRNCIVEVKKEGKQILSYADVDLSVWRGQVIDRDYIHTDHHESEYRTFIWKIAGENEQKYKAFQTVIGYLLHSWKSNSNNKAIIFNDELISDSPNGRSGKGLFWNALKHLKHVQSLDGKQFDFTKAFPYQNVSTDCQVLVFDDVKKGFDFESLFSVITEGITIEYKGKDSIKLNVTESPKIIITTNYTIKGDSASFNARKHEVEMSTFFSDKFTPIDLFGHELFNDWDNEEWARFDCYMIECLRIYLDLGLLEMPTVNLEFKKVINEITQELYNFFEGLNRNEYYTTKALYEEFIAQYPEKRNYITQNKMTINISRYCKYLNFELDKVTSGGITKIKIITNEQPQQEDDTFSDF
jgi:hypothetical protein